MVIAVVAFSSLWNLFAKHGIEVPRQVAFLAPVQPAGQVVSVEVSNVPEEATVFRALGIAWPAILALFVWAYGWVGGRKWTGVLGWTLIAWAALRWPNGAPAFLAVIAVFLVLRLAIPVLRRILNVPEAPKPEAPPPAPSTGTSAAAAAALVLTGILSFSGTASAQQPAPYAHLPAPPRPAF